MNNNQQEEITRDLRLAEQAILGQSLEEKNQKIAALEQRVELLEEMLNRLATQRAPYPQPLPQPSPCKMVSTVRCVVPERDGEEVATWPKYWALARSAHSRGSANLCALR